MNDPVTLPPERRVRRWHTYLAVWNLHRVLGLGFGALLGLLSLTGSVLVVHENIERTFDPNRHVVPAPPRDAIMFPLADLARTTASLAPPGYRLLRVLPANEPDATHEFLFAGADNLSRWTVFVAPATGAVLWTGPEQSLFIPWLLRLHMQLRAGRAGYYATGIAGLGLTLLSLSGIYIHRERFNGFGRHPFRLRLGWRVALSDLHKWIGLFSLYFPIALGVTGTLYTLSGLKVKTPPPVARPLDVRGLAPLEPMLATAREKLPGTEILRVQFPSSTGGAVTVLLLHRDAPPWRKFSRVEFDAATGAVRTVHVAAEAPATDQFAAMLAPLHFGFYGAPWVKWTYFAGGLAPAALALTGTALCWLRRRAQKKCAAASLVRPAPLSVGPPTKARLLNSTPHRPLARPLPMTPLARDNWHFALRVLAALALLAAFILAIHLSADPPSPSFPPAAVRSLVSPARQAKAHRLRCGSKFKINRGRCQAGGGRLRFPMKPAASLRCEIHAPTSLLADLAHIARFCAKDASQAICTVSRETLRGEPAITLHLPVEAAATQHPVWCLACRLACFCPNARVSVLVRAETAFGETAARARRRHRRPA